MKEAKGALNKVYKGFHVGDPPAIPKVDMIPIMDNPLGTIQTMLPTSGDIFPSLGEGRVTLRLRRPIFIP